MKNLALAAMLACLILPLAACVTPINGPDGIGVAVSPLAGLGRVQAGEDAAKAYGDELAEGLSDLAEAVGEAEIAAAADAAKLKSDMDAAVLKAADDAAIDWTTVILAALGVGGLGTGGMAYRKKLLATQPSKEA